MTADERKRGIGRARDAARELRSGLRMNKLLLLRLSLLCAPVLAFVACGGVDETANGAPPTSAPGAASDAPPDAGPAPTNGRDASAGPPTGDGAIFLSSDPKGRVEVAAEFRSHTPTSSEPAPGSDDCVYFATPPPVDQFVANVSAGSVDATAGSSHVALEWTASAKVYTGEGLEAGFGVPITIQATGADVPAFSVTTHVPPPVQLTTSAASGIAKGADFDVAWTAGSADTSVILTLAGKTASVECATTSDHGSVRIPKAMVDGLANDPQSDGGTSHLTLTVSPLIQTAVRAGDYAVNVYSNNVDATLELPLH